MYTRLPQAPVTGSPVPHLTSLYHNAEAGPYGARIIGEPPIIPPGAAVGNAIMDAIGKPIHVFPATPERVFKALHSNGH